MAMAQRVAATLRVKYKIDFIFDSEGPGRVATTQPVARWPVAMANGHLAIGWVAATLPGPSESNIKSNLYLTRKGGAPLASQT